MKELNSKKNFIWNAIGLTLYGFVSLFLLVVVKRINGIDIAGIFTYAFSLTTLFFYISLYYSRVYQIANYNNSKTFNQFFSARLLFSLVSIIITIIFCIINGFTIYKCSVIILLMFFRIIDAISDTFYGYQQDKGYLYRAGISYSVKSVVGTLLFILVDFLTNNLILSIIALVLVNIIVLFIYDVKYFKLFKNKISLDFSNVKLILYEAFPIFVFSFLNIYVMNSQKYVLNYYVTNDIQTIFGILVMPATVLCLIGGYLIMPFLGSLKDFYKRKDYDSLYNLSFKILVALFIFGILCLIVCYLIGIPVLNVIYAIDLLNYKMLLLIIIIGATLNAMAMIISNIMTLIGYNKIQLFIYLSVSILSTIMNVLLIRKAFIDGAVYSYLITFSVMFFIYIVTFIMTRKKLNIRYEK